MLHTPSSMLFRVMGVACAALFVAGLASAATHDDGSVTTTDRASSETDDTTTTTATGTDDSATSTSVAEDAEAGATGADADGSATTAGDTDHPTPTSPATVASPDTTAPAAGGSASEGVGRQATTPGTYTYDVTGTVNGQPVDETSTLKVSSPDADGRQVHEQSGPDGSTTTTYRHAAEGTYLERLEVAAEGQSFEMKATSPFLLLPADAGPGTTTSGQLKGDGMTADITFTLREVGAEIAIAEIHVDLNGTMSGIEVTGTMDSTIQARVSDQLPLVTDSESDISAGGGIYRMRSDTRSELRS